MSRARRLLAGCALAVAGSAVLVPAIPAVAAPAPFSASAFAAHPSGSRVVTVPMPPAQAAPAVSVVPAAAPAVKVPGPSPSTAAPGISVDLEGGKAGRSQAVSIIILMTVLSIAPSLLLLMTSFTKMIIVLGLTRQALGTPTIPPNQVLAGIALFLSLFVMWPVLSEVNDAAIQPYMNDTITMTQAFERGEAPLRTFMLKQTGSHELQTMVNLNPGQDQPAKPEDVAFTTLVPAFVLSELKSAFIIGFVIFVPFLVIDLVVASILMSMGMMMLPPVMISLPFKILLFIMVDGWSLITSALVTGYTGGGG